MHIHKTYRRARSACFAPIVALIFAIAGQTMAFAQSRKPVPVAADLGAAIKAIEGADVSATDANGIPTFLKGAVAKVGHTGKGIIESDLVPALEKAAAVHRLKASDVKLDRLIVDNLGFTHARYSQTKNGLPVVGSQLDLHVNRDGVVYAIVGNAHDGENLPAVASVSAIAAIQTAEALHAGTKLKPSKERLVYVISTKDQSMHLAHEIEIENTGTAPRLHELVYVDAISGALVDAHSLIFNDDIGTIYDWNHGTTSAAAEYDFTNPSTDPNSIGTPNAIYNTNIAYVARTYSFYSSQFGRNAYDGNGGRILTSVNLAGANAFYDPSQNLMAFGDGQASVYDNFANALDVTSHEYTHGVTYNTSGLIYANEPGALNEALSDILGTASKVSWNNNVQDSNTWKLGHDICLSGAPHDAIRYMDNPTADGQSKDYYPDRYVLAIDQVPNGAAGGNDNGYVHLNSGIANLAFKLLVTGGTHPRAGQYSSGAGANIPTTSVPSIGMAEAQAIFYRADTTYLTPGAQFMDARAATVSSAQDLYGSSVASAVAIAWDVVGVPTQSNRNPVNISTRAQVGTDANIMIAGFVLSGGGSPKNMLIRGVGPTLSSLGVSGTLADPQLTLFSGTTQLDYNDDWSSSSNASAIASTASQVGAFALPNPSKDSALLENLGNGSYTAQISGVNGQTGIALVEVYDTDSSNPNHLTNISTRAQVSSGAPQIAGFVINGSGNKYLLIRAIGPGLASTFGLSGTLPHPQIQLYSGSTQIRYNANWTVDEAGHDQSYVINEIDQKVGAFGLNTSNTDAAMLVSLPAGSYSAIVSDVNGNSGIALVEVYVVN